MSERCETDKTPQAKANATDKFNSIARHNQRHCLFDNAATTNQAIFSAIFNSLLENVKPRSLYLQKFGQEFSKPTLQDGEGSWKDPNCTLHLVIKDGKIVATGNFSRPMNALAAAASMEKPSSEEIVVEYRGNVTGNTAKCQVTRKPTNPPKRVASLLSSAASTNTCLFAWNNDGKKISVCENPFESNPTFYAIESIE